MSLATIETPKTQASVTATRVLIVDDESSVLSTLSEILESHGYYVACAPSGEAALTLARSQGFDVALIDLVLPDRSGYDLVAALRELSPKLSCIIMTGYASVEKVMQAVNLRVRGFLLKPLEIPMVLSRIEEVVQVARLERYNEQLLEALQAAYDQLTEQYKQEHRIAEILQHALLPSFPDRFGPFEVGEFYQAGLKQSQVGGDVYDLLRLEHGRIGILMADVSGKGLNAAVQMGLVRHSIRALAQVFQDPKEVVRQLDRVTLAHGEFTGFVTLFYGVLEPNGKLVYVNAGHEPPLLYSFATDAVRTLDGTGPFVGAGVFEEPVFESATATLARSDMLLLFTDGLSEIIPTDTIATVERLRGWLAGVKNDPAQAAAEKLRSLSLHSTTDEFRDDIAILLLRYVPEEP